MNEAGRMMKKKLGVRDQGTQTFTRSVSTRAPADQRGLARAELLQKVTEETKVTGLTQRRKDAETQRRILCSEAGEEFT